MRGECLRSVVITPPALSLNISFVLSTVSFRSTELCNSPFNAIAMSDGYILRNDIPSVLAHGTSYQTLTSALRIAFRVVLSIGEVADEIAVRIIYDQQWRHSSVSTGINARRKNNEMTGSSSRINSSRRSREANRE